MSISKLFKIRVNEYKWQICALTIGTRRGTQFCKEGGNACPRSSEASFCFAVPRLKPWSQFHAVLAQGGSQFHAALHQHSTVGSQFHVGDPNSMWGIPIPCGGSQFHVGDPRSQFHVGDPNSMWGIPIPCGGAARLLFVSPSSG